MELLLKRINLQDSYTEGVLYLKNGHEEEILCNTLEDKVRDYNKDGDLNDDGEGKVYGKTAIPYGRYKIVIDVVSSKFSKYEFYRKVCDGKLPRLLNVPHFDGVLLHVADGYRGADLLEGCIGVGKNKIKGGLLYGKEVFTELYAKLEQAKRRGESIWITIL